MGPPRIEQPSPPPPHHHAPFWLVHPLRFARMLYHLAKAMQRRTPKWVPHVFGYALSAGCLFWVLRNYSFRDLIPQIRRLEWWWVALAVAADLAVYVCHGWRWILLLRPVARVPLWRTVQSIYIGLFANEVLPLRPGELIRCYLLAHWNEILISVVLASWAIERLIDGVWMLLMFILTASFVTGLPAALKDGAIFLALVVAAGIAVLAYVVMHKTHAHSMVREGRWAATLRHIVEGLHTMSSGNSLPRVVAVSFLYLALQVLSYWALMKAFDFDFSIWVAASTLTIVRLSTLIPNAPGNVGLFQAACVVALNKVFGAEPTAAKDFSFVLFFALTMPLLIGGAVATALSGLNIGEIHHHARTKMKTTHPAPKSAT